MVMSEKAKAARREYQRRYRAENKDRYNEMQRDWRRRNPEKVQQYRENYYNKLAERYENEGG